MIINVTDTGKLCKNVELTLEPADYLAEYDNELKKFKNRVDLKGYRKGKAPISLVQMHYGKALLSDIISKKTQENIMDYARKNFKNLYYFPIPEKPFDEHDLQPKSREKSYTINFAVAETSDYAIAGISSDDEYTQYFVKATDEMLDKSLKQILEYHRTFEDTDKITGENGIIELEVDNQLPDRKEGEDKDHLRYRLDNADKDYIRQNLLGKEIGAAVEIDLKQLYPNMEDDFLKKNYLRHIENPENFIVVGEISRIQEKTIPELNEDLIETYYKHKGINSVEELKDDVRKSIEGQYGFHLRRKLYKDIMEKIMNDTTLELPEMFIKEYLLDQDSIKRENFDYAEVEKELKWRFLRENLIARFGIESTQEEVDREVYMYVADQMRNYGINQPDLVYKYFLQSKDDKNLRENAENELNTVKMYEEILKLVKVKDEEISGDEFDKMMDSGKDKELEVE